jgi:fatty-acyl-CoA synthase
VNQVTPGRRWSSATTLGDLLARRAAEHGDRQAVVFPDRAVSYAELAARADQFARGLLALGAGPGDTVGFLLNEEADALAVLFGAAAIGAVPVPVNARFKAFELSSVLAHSRMRVLVTRPPGPAGTDFPALLTEVLPGLAAARPGDLHLEQAPGLRQIVLLGDEERPGLLTEAAFGAGGDRVDPAQVAARAARVRIRDTAVVMYTSGTTASPKGAMLSHEAFCRFADGAVGDRLGWTAEDRVWTALPLFHIGGIAFAVACVHAGCTYLHAGHFRPDVALDHLERQRATVALAAFETIWLAVLNQPDFAQRDLSRVRIVMAVGVPARLRQMAARLPHATQVSCFGQTEACSFLSLSHLDDTLEERVSTGGMPLPGMECRVVDPATGKDLPPDTEGELLYRGPNCFDGYFRDPELTARAFDDEGWFRTGDVATMDADGRVTFISRLKDMLKVGGENVSAAEVESYLVGHPAVEIVQVVAAPDAYYTEVPAAFIQLKPGHTATAEEIIDFCRGRIAGYRVPRYVRFVADWPMSGTKIKKHVLRDRIAAELTAAGITEAPRPGRDRARPAGT